MQRRTQLGLILVLTISTAVWVVLMVASVNQAGPIITPADALNYITQPTLLFRAVYINAALLTLINVIVMAGFYSWIYEKTEFWAPIYLVLTAIYGLLNLFVYLSQVTIVPRLLALYQVSEYRASVETLLLLFVQVWDGSFVAVLNSLAYGLFGIPSLIFGYAMVRYSGWKKITGILYVLSGITAMFGFVGVVLQNALLSSGVAISGLLFLMGLIGLSIVMAKGELKSTQR